MKSSIIKFGTDGWRGIIARDFTFDNVKIVSASAAAYLKERFHSPKVVIGYDTRFHSKRFAQTCAAVLSNSGIKTVLSDSFVSTPCISNAVVHMKFDLGIVISASHNPSNFNGFKIKTFSGSSAPKDITDSIEKNIGGGKYSIPEDTKQNYEILDLKQIYFNSLIAHVDMKAVKKSRVKVVIDTMHGAASGYISAILKKTNADIITIHENPDPLFGGLHPEPIEPYLAELKKAVKMQSAACGLATDGDADRIGVVDDTGRYLTPHQVFPLLLYYLCKYKGLRGKVVQALSLGYVSQKIAKAYNLEFEEVPIGFKYIAERITNEKILIGGEESGGYGFGSFLPERDGVLNSLKIIEILAVTGKPLSVLIKEIEKQYGKSAYLRTDFVNPGILKDEFVNTMKKHAPENIAGLRIKEIKDYDGLEFVLEDDSWLLLRPSGTEPVIRVYCESAGISRTRQIIAIGENLVSQLVK